MDEINIIADDKQELISIFRYLLEQGAITEEEYRRAVAKAEVHKVA